MTVPPQAARGTSRCIAGEDGRYALSAHGRALLDALRPLSDWAGAWASSGSA